MPTLIRSRHPDRPDERTTIKARWLGIDCLLMIHDSVCSRVAGTVSSGGIIGMGVTGGAADGGSICGRPLPKASGIGALNSCSVYR